MTDLATDPRPAPAPPSQTLWERLKAAKVPHLLGVYAGGSFAVLQAADIFVDRLGLPDWTFFGLLLVLAAGVPVTLLTAFVQSSSRSLRLQGVFTWKNTTLAGVGSLVALGLGVGLFMGARALGMGPVGSLLAAGVLDREELILIADFQSPTGDDLLAGAITEAFRIDFEQSPLVRVVSPGAVRDALLRMQRPPDSPLTPELARELAVREGLKAILMGEINRAGAGSIISVRLVSPGSEEAIVSFRETVADSSGVISAVDRLSNRMRERIGESLRSIRGGEPLEQVSTSSLLALRRYSQGIRAIELERDFPTGIALLEEAIAEDSTFAMAWRKLGVTLSNEGYPEERWREAFTRAHELSDRLTERERYLTRAAYFNSVERDQERAMATYRTLLESYPNETTALNNLAVIHVNRGERREGAELLRRALAADSSGVLYYTNLAFQEIALGELEAADRTLTALRARFPDVLMGEALSARVAWARGRHQEAESRFTALLEHRRATVTEQEEAAWGLVSLAALRGRGQEAFRRLDRVVEVREARGLAVPPGAHLQFRASYRLTTAGDTAEAVRLVDEFLGQEPLPDEAAFEGAHLSLAAFFGQAGHGERGRSFLEASDRITAGKAAPPVLEELREDVRSLYAFLNGRPEEALAHHRKRIAEGTQRAESQFSLAELHRRLGSADSAVVHFEGYLAIPPAERFQNDTFALPWVLQRLAELHEERGSPEAAREYYLRFAELWAEADAELQPRVLRAKERAAALAPKGS